MIGVKLVKFIEARLREDERTAHAALAAMPEGHAWRLVRQGNGLISHLDEPRMYATDHNSQNSGFHHEDHVAHIARHDPARVLRDVEATRRIVARFDHRLSMQPGRSRNPRDWDDLTRHYYETALDLASRWADHPDYDPAWTPERTVDS